MYGTHSNVPSITQFAEERVDIHQRTEKVTFGVIYRPPNLGRQDTDVLLQEISRACRTRNVCVVGDFN